MKGQKVVAIIPARGGSKGIPKKNIVDLGGFPLIAYSIVVAKLSKLIERVIVSTDIREIADIAVKYGAEVPFIRPKKIAGDKSPDIGFMNHAIGWFLKNEKVVPEYWIHLRPTTPLRNPILVDKAIRNFVKNKKATALCSAHELPESPNKFFKIKNHFFVGLLDENMKLNNHNLPRQSFSPAYHPNGYVDILKTSTIKQFKNIHGPRIMPFITDPIIELDKPYDLEYIKFDLERSHLKIYDYLRDND